MHAFETPTPAGRALAISLACLAAWCVAPPHAWAGQEGEQKIRVQVKLSQDGVHDSSEIFVALELAIEPGWHINSANPPDESMIPTSVEVSPSGGIVQAAIRYPKGEQRKLGFSDDLLDVYEGRVFILVKLRVGSGVRIGQHMLEAALTYQACNKSICLAPSVLRVKIPLQVVGREAEVKRMNPELFTDF
ncbi:MAG TPA: protein-disulfide reductase DsbD N-terminal domain-containing protein [Bacteroidota bacterium]|nr:protein-disulfide reductase DsbD N-terminal domain-containing protein [Bacteroidota bacterium]